MTAEGGCAGVEERLTEALLAREEPDATSRAHAEACSRCGTLLHELVALRARLDRLGEADVPQAVRERTLGRARSLLAGGIGAAQIPRGLPQGYRSECLRLLGAALLPLPLVVAWNLALLAVGERLLAPFVPPVLLSTLAVGYLVAAAGWFALVYGSIPIVAHRRALRKLAEVRS